MPASLKIAAIQMDAAPAPTTERLKRAADLVAEAASAGAELIVLPELFNTGYQYHDDNYALAEGPEGQTATWLKEQAALHHIHLAGTFMLRENQEIYNRALLFAPDGRSWRYDKRHPWAMERAYFRGSDNITVAETDLGKFGMMICWDSAHPYLWQEYAGKVDALIIMSCPPKISSADWVFPDGKRVNMRDLGPIFRHIYTDEEFFPGADADSQAAWMNVPVVATVGGGKIDTPLPMAGIALASFLLLRPRLWKWLGRAKEVRLQTGFDKQSKIIGPGGKVLARVQADGDGFTLAEVALSEGKPQGKQPKMKTHPLVYFLSDIFAPALATWQYRRKVKRIKSN